MRGLPGLLSPQPAEPPLLYSAPPPVERESEDRVGRNMVIILAGILCVLICGLGLSSAARWAKRRALFSGRTAHPPARRAVVMGLKKRKMQQIPVVLQKQSVGAAATDCVICLGILSEGEMVKVLPLCKHHFHAHCIDKWLSLCPSCPTCRCSLLDTPAAAAADRIS